MNVSKNRPIKKLIILGSGESILKLTKDEIEYINKCNIVIAVNKYMAFYDLIGIIPTHIYFHDIFGSDLFKLILSKCINDKLENITIITNPIFKLFTYKERISILTNFFKYISEFAASLIFIRIGLIVIINYIKSLKNISSYKIPSSWKIIGIRVSKWNKGGKWASDFTEPIFHYRGSLSSVLNIATIIAPEQEIFLIGNDFNGSKYFYEHELNATDIHWRDFTYESTKDAGVHFSFQDIKGTSITDKFPFMLENLNKYRNKLFCINKDSLLVKEANVEFKTLF